MKIENIELVQKGNVCCLWCDYVEKVNLGCLFGEKYDFQLQIEIISDMNKSSFGLKRPIHVAFLA